MKSTTCVVLVLSALSAVPAQAKQVCGWYAIAACTRSQADAGNFASNGWGSVIDTNSYTGFRRGYYCVVSGPQSKSSAARDVRVATANDVADGMYIKRACTDERNLVD